jgi:hypothetical protein
MKARMKVPWCQKFGRNSDLKKNGSDLNLFPLVIDVLKPGQEEAAVVARPDVSVLLLLQKK